MKEVNRSIALSTTAYELLRSAAFERRITQKRIIEEALRTYLGSNPSVDAPSTPAADTHAA